MWWCNEHGEKSKFNINYNKYLKEFLIANPPTFKISNKCCYYAKKMTSKQANKSYSCDLNIVGIRKSEGGVRSSAYKSCFSNYDDKEDEYRPLFFYKNKDRNDYEKAYNIMHSKCYTEYGLHRTRCAGCPYGKDFEFELEIIKEHEPKLYNAVNNIFKDSYEYTRMYHKFRQEKKGQR